jgi:hypothetical protein
LCIFLFLSQPTATKVPNIIIASEEFRKDSIMVTLELTVENSVHYCINFTAKCDSPILLLSEDSERLVNADYSHPAIEGTNVSFTCPPGLVLTGPSVTMCMGNGEWEPDPSQIWCNGKEYSKHMRTETNYIKPYVCMSVCVYA